ncbi:hypothetical protein Hanom_Chr14g01309241 [Helianthus anomalus]
MTSTYSFSASNFILHFFFFIIFLSELLDNQVQRFNLFSLADNRDLDPSFSLSLVVPCQILWMIQNIFDCFCNKDTRTSLPIDIPTKVSNHNTIVLYNVFLLRANDESDISNHFSMIQLGSQL